MGTEKSWKKADIRYENYLAFIKNKPNCFELSLIDLLYISNFKGGGATINGKEKDINTRLRSYSKKLQEIDDSFGKYSLSQIGENDLENLIGKVRSICTLVQIAKIDGFGVSYLSALLCAYFPKLMPIIDKNILDSCGFKYKQYFTPKGIEEFIEIYLEVIKKIRKYIRDNQIDEELRKIDKKLFIGELNIEESNHDKNNPSQPK